MSYKRLNNYNVSTFVENNIDEYFENEHLEFIKKCFWENKNKNYFNNDRFNVSIQIRRENSHDSGCAGERATTPNQYYLNIMNLIREKYKNKNILFHIYSQGSIKNFVEFMGEDVYFHLDEDIINTFIGMVASEVLVISPSSFSYVAALISDGEIYYKQFWHNPRKKWIVCG
jgi:hypothetical protein